MPTAAEPDELDIDPVPSEIEDEESSLPAFEILTYPADWTLEVLVDKWRKNQLKIPTFQRHFVWTRVQASKLIESFLLGLPVPAIFLFSSPSDENSQLVVDGQQRLKSLAYFFEGYFGDERAERRQVFRLVGLHKKSPYLGKTYQDLQETDPGAFNRLNDSVLRAFIIKQLDPADDTSIYHVFERLNTGGTSLHPQEIRNCINYGSFNDLLNELNVSPEWRDILGKSEPDKRQRDMELILRFFALADEARTYEPPMKEFLNTYMRKKQNARPNEIDRLRTLFTTVTSTVHRELGPKPFHLASGLNAAAFDATYSALATNRKGSISPGAKVRFRRLMASEGFRGMVRSNTTDREAVRSRRNAVETALFSHF